MIASKIYTEKALARIMQLKSTTKNLILVWQGQSDLLDSSFISEWVTDLDSFYAHGNDAFFDKNWFAGFFMKLNQAEDCHLISYPQFSYLTHHLDEAFFKDRVVILRDNLRILFPLKFEDYQGDLGQVHDSEERPIGMPIYQAEHFSINEQCFFSLKTPMVEFNAIDLFEEKISLSGSDDDNLELINIGLDPLGLDLFVNQCFGSNDFSRKAKVIIPRKHPNAKQMRESAELLNCFLNGFGGGVFLQEIQTAALSYTPKQETLDLLHQYWGKDADFKPIEIYKTPDFSNELVEISQGYFVETIINEYEKSKKGKTPRDFFLTAPTGAGKSLLFQLPAFHVSNKGDMTIVVSPLIALMKDQVDAVRFDRQFNKVAYLNSELTLIDRERIIEGCKSGEIDVLYLSPELLLSYDIKYFLGNRKLGLLVIDEAHLITTWGRDFRVDYWFLGNHIWKIRKHHEMNFPMVAVTATAIYGGDNDMAFDGMESLAMNLPHTFIGKVKRKEISFVINNHDRFTNNYDSNKIKQTVDFIKDSHKLGFKTLVYAPYKSHIRSIINDLNSQGLHIAAAYHGSLSSQLKELAYQEFKTGQKKVMVCTKAFGMGIDIPDIQVIYHHAPSGLLPDYVQEIGRAARKKNTEGFALLNYSAQDQRYSKALHGLSAIRLFQLKEVLKKLNNTYLKNGKKRNLLLSVDDFAHIFQDALDLDQKVLTSLMMIEKDYLKKTRFSVLVARPKQLFAKVYAKIKVSDLDKFVRLYNPSYEVLSEDHAMGNCVIELDLDLLWQRHFANSSFPTIKKGFYEKTILSKHGIELAPQIRVSIGLNTGKEAVFNTLNQALEKLKKVFAASTQRFFKADEFEEALKKEFADKEIAKKLAKFVLSSYSGRMTQPGQIAANAFLQERKNIEGFEYRVFNNQYLQNFATILKKFGRMFDGNKLIADRYISNLGSDIDYYTTLGSLLEILDLGTFEIKGGDKPMVFVRLNDPARIARDSVDRSYSNILLTKTLERHTISNQIFDHFFLRTFTNEERWDFIEAFFLGESMDDLVVQYPGGGANHVDVVKELNQFHPSPMPVASKEEVNLGIHRFHPESGRNYFEDHLLTLTVGEELVTKKVIQWITDDPVSLDKAIHQFGFTIHESPSRILKSKLVANHQDYLKKKLGLRFLIDFKGYSGLVQAIVPYKDKPVEFYKWWCGCMDKIWLSFEDKLNLIHAVYQQNPAILKKEHRDLMTSRG
jgi:RecQ family ATP-dependent DNA helicase